MATQTTPDLSEFVTALRDLGYPHPTEKDGFVSGSVYRNVDLSDAEKSVPEGKNTGPFATLDDPVSHVPDDIMTLADEYGLDVQVMGHGGDSLTLYVSSPEKDETAWTCIQCGNTRERPEKWMDGHHPSSDRVMGCSECDSPEWHKPPAENLSDE